MCCYTSKSFTDNFLYGFECRTAFETCQCTPCGWGENNMKARPVRKFRFFLFFSIFVSFCLKYRFFWYRELKFQQQHISHIRIQIKNIHIWNVSNVKRFFFCFLNFLFVAVVVSQKRFEKFSFLKKVNQLKEKQLE